MHGGITHTPIFGLIFLLPAFYFLKKKKHKLSAYFFLISFGIIFHIFLDFILGGGLYEGVMFFWPLSTQLYKIHLLASTGIRDLPVIMDALILLFWLWHEEKNTKSATFFNLFQYERYSNFYTKIIS